MNPSAERIKRERCFHWAMKVSISSDGMSKTLMKVI